MSFGFNLPNIKTPDLSEIQKSLAEARESEYASGFCKRLVEMINEFDESLDDEHEVGMRLVTFGQAVTFHVTDIGYYNPSLIRFYGKMDDGSDVELIQHISQISFLLMAVKRINPQEPKKRIGFTSE